MARSFIFIVVANVLSTFRIEKAVRDGCVIEPTGAYSPGIFACVLRPISLKVNLNPASASSFLGVPRSSSAQSNRGQGKLKDSSAPLRPREPPSEPAGGRFGALCGVCNVECGIQ